MERTLFDAVRLRLSGGCCEIDCDVRGKGRGRGDLHIFNVHTDSKEKTFNNNEHNLSFHNLSCTTGTCISLFSMT